MTSTLPSISEETRPAVARRSRLHWARRGAEWIGLLVLLGFLVFDRVRLFQEYLAKFIDEDQGIEWNAAHELLRGHLHEPCFFGQAYNSNLEGYLAAPLVALHVPYPVAVPVATVLLGLLPFLLIAAAAVRRGRMVVAALALALPTVLSTRYGIITGMPRGFVTGVAVASIVAILYLPRRTSDPLSVAKSRRRLWGWGIAGRSWPKLRYFVAGLLAVVALMLNPNCALLLAAVAVYGVLTTWREWRFWLFSLLGMLAAAPYPLLVYKYYYVWHPDHAIYPDPGRVKSFVWSWQNFWSYIHSFCEAGFGDLVPRGWRETAGPALGWIGGKLPAAQGTWMAHNPACSALVLASALLLVALILRFRLAAAAGLLAAAALTVASFAYGRIHDGRTAVSFPYSRMYLAVPVIWVWMCLLLNAPRRFRTSGAEGERSGGLRRSIRAVRRWGAPVVSIVLVGLLAWWGGTSALAKSRSLAQEAKQLNAHAQVAVAVPQAQLWKIAGAINRAAAKEHVRFVLINGFDGRKWDYALPEITPCETLFPSFERRTWRMVAECFPRYGKIFVLGRAPNPRRARGFDPVAISRDPPLTMYTLHGFSVIDFCKRVGVRVRPFDAPSTPPPPTLPAPPRPPRPAAPGGAVERIHRKARGDATGFNPAVSVFVAGALRIQLTHEDFV